MSIDSPKQPPQHGPSRSEEETILESSLESFPASDPPAWVFGKDRPPKDTSTAASEQPQRPAKKAGLLKRLMLGFPKDVPAPKDTPHDTPSYRSPQ